MLDGGLQRLVDEADIRAVTHRYGRGCDRLDFELVRSCFTDDAIADFGGYRGDVEGLIELITGYLTQDISTTHYMLNHEFDFVSDEIAYVETKIWGFHRQPPRDGAPLQDAFMSGTYADRFEKRDGEWKIAHRMVLFGTSRIDPVIGEFPYPPGARPLPRLGAEHSAITRPENPPPLYEP